MGYCKDLVSIIIPVYNGEKYLAACLDSVTAQTYPEIEILVIDDGSTDASAEVCKRYASADNRIRLISKANSGVSDTRNTGIADAEGEFIVFIDCDDTVGNEYIANLVSLMNDDVDFGITGWKKENEGGAFIEDCVRIEGSFGAEECLSKLISTSAVQGYPFARIFRSSLIQDKQIEFDKDITLFEDLLFCCEYAKNCGKTNINTGYIDYHYVIRENSARNRSVQSTTFDPVWITEIDSLKKLLPAVEDHPKIKRMVRGRIALSSSFYINRMFDCGYTDRELQSGLRRNIRKNLFQVLFSPVGDFKWKMQAFLNVISPKLEYRLKSR